VVTVRGAWWTLEWNVIGHTPARASSEQAWEPMASSSGNFLSKNGHRTEVLVYIRNGRIVSVSVVLIDPVRDSMVRIERKAGAICEFDA
jgi:hypothetical protein